LSKKFKFSKKKRNKQKQKKKNVVSHLFIDHWIYKSVNNNKMGFIQAKCLIRVKIDFFKEAFAYMVFVTCWLFQNYQASPKFPKISKISKIPKWKDCPNGYHYLRIFLHGAECQFSVSWPISYPYCFGTFEKKSIRLKIEMDNLSKR